MNYVPNIVAGSEVNSKSVVEERRHSQLKCILNPIDQMCSMVHCPNILALPTIVKIGKNMLTYDFGCVLQFGCFANQLYCYLCKRLREVIKKHIVRQPLTLVEHMCGLEHWGGKLQEK